MIPFLLGDCAVDEWTIAHALDFLADTLPDMIARDGRRRELGNLVTLYPVLDGAFAGGGPGIRPRAEFEVFDLSSTNTRKSQ